MTNDIEQDVQDLTAVLGILAAIADHMERHHGAWTHRQTVVNARDVAARLLHRTLLRLEKGS